MKKDEYVRNKIRIYLKACKEGKIEFSFTELKSLKIQWEFEYKVEKFI